MEHWIQFRILISYLISKCPTGSAGSRFGCKFPINIPQDKEFEKSRSSTMAVSITDTKTSDFLSFSGRKRTIVGDVARKADFSEIPVISMLSPQHELVTQIRDACTRVGFFYISDHGIPQESIDNVLTSAETFFAMPEEDKNEIHFSKSTHFRGYEGVGDNVTETGRKPDLNEQFNWGYQADLDPERNEQEIEHFQQHTKDNVMIGPNSWPSKCPELKQNIVVYYQNVLKLARKLIKLFALALDLPENYFDELFKTPGAIGRVLHYFAQDPKQENVLGIGAHTDIECFTILYQGQVPALQVLNNEGQWIMAPPIEKTFVINIGDMLARWSNDVFISTVHRVFNVSGRERYSIPVFIGVDYTTSIEPLETCVGEEGPKYEPVNAGEYVYKRLAFSRTK